MKSILQLRDKIEGNVFTLAQVQAALGPGKSNYSTVSNLLKTQDLIRVRRGLYVFGDRWRSTPLALFSLANLIYGPSYVSLHSLLSYYGLIPEAMKQTTSVNTKKTKKYQTPFGVFQYRAIPLNAFPKGVISISEKTKRFIGATPEKALLDTLYLAHTSDLLSYATESLRIEPTDLSQLNQIGLLELSQHYSNKQFVKRVKKLVKDL